MLSQNELKEKAAQTAVSLVKNNMKLGIGTGSTVDFFVKLLAKEIQKGLKIVGVATSEQTAALCRSLTVPLTTLEEHPVLDLTIDGADEVDPNLQLIKGGGGALLREKITAFASKEMVVIIDESKKVNQLGNFPLPIEVNRFGWKATKTALQQLAEKFSLTGDIILRHQASIPFITDEGHYILDAHWSKLSELKILAAKLEQIPGVVQHGLFIDMATKVIVAQPNGDIKIIEAKDKR
ncbi:ribose-5-phosphate isomerase RpiA [Bartonella sp. DGB1]|uniref:ribose-5-phosphate isomerase RpiA n=1 Tax=Bartonella sp. DGB1 TaxID=3239807 RepID=UPI003525AE8C